MVNISDELYNSLIGMFFLHRVNKSGVWAEGCLTIEEMQEHITSGMAQRCIDFHPDAVHTWSDK